MKITAVVGAAILAAALSGAASAATLSLVGPYAVDGTVTKNDLGYNGSVNYITGAAKTSTNGLSVNGPVKVTYTYLGKEASNTNYAADLAGIFFNTATTAVGTSYTVTQLTAGLLDFAFGTSAPVSAISRINNNGTASPSATSYAIGYVQVSATRFVALFDDIARGDRDFDDIAMQIDVEDLAPVPVPAAGLTLLGAMGALGALARKRRAVA